MDSIVLTRDHFYNIRKRVDAYTYSNPSSCPIAKSLKQSYPSLYFIVSESRVTVWTCPSRGKDMLQIEGSMKNVERCRLELLNGATEARIKVISFTPEWIRLTS